MRWLVIGLLGVILALCVSILQRQSTSEHGSNYQCVKAETYAAGESGWVFAIPNISTNKDVFYDLTKIGEVGICGYDVAISDIVGPRLDVFFDGDGLKVKRIQTTPTPVCSSHSAKHSRKETAQSHTC